MSALNLSGILFIASLLCACSSSPPPPAEPIQASEEKHTQLDRKAEKLSAGEPVTVNTSQGEVTIEPNVVAITDNPDPSQPVPPYYDDPLEGFNRAMFGFNHYLYRYLMIPVADGYKFLLPTPVRTSIGNAFSNLREPLNLVNNLFAGDVTDAGTNLGRFVINSTIGLLGLFDPATDWFEIAPQKQTIAETLYGYGVGAGPYIVLPVLGPSDARGTVSTVTGSYIHPISLLSEPPDSYYLWGVNGIDDFSLQSDSYQILYEQSDDPYVFFRNQYIQGQRRDEVFQYQPEAGDGE